MEEKKLNMEMVKKLVIIRHGKSELFASDNSDINRELRKKGRNDATFVSKQLLEASILPDLVLCSPALRAKQTAEIFGAQLQFNNWVEVESIYDETFDSDLLVFEIEKAMEKADTVFVFGHNPTLKDLVYELTDALLDHLPTSTAVLISFGISEWEEIINGKKGKIIQIFEKE